MLSRWHSNSTVLLSTCIQSRGGLQISNCRSAIKLAISAWFISLPEIAIQALIWSEAADQRVLAQLFDDVDNGLRVHGWSFLKTAEGLFGGAAPAASVNAREHRLAHRVLERQRVLRGHEEPLFLLRSLRQRAG